MSEIWRDIVDFEGLYQVSSLGNVRRHPDKQSKNKYVTPKPLSRALHENRDGYLYATLSRNGKACKRTVHQLVATSFLPNAVYGCVINHLNGNKKDNRVSNLEVTTHQGNNLHAHKNGLTPKPGKSVYHNVHIRLSRYKDKTYTYYVAKIKDNYKILFIKQFTCEIEAAKAVDDFLDSIGDTKRQRNFP